MIEINLIPDVKLELIRVRRLRTMVISGAIIASIAAGAVVILFASYVLGVQAVQKKLSEDTISKEMIKLQDQKDLPKLLTMQNQLNELQSAHDKKVISSRSFDLMTTILPTTPNKVSLTKLSIDVVAKKISIEGEAENGYESLEVFKKTLAVTKLVYVDGTESKNVLVASDIQEGDRSYGERADGKRVLRFTLSFTYAEEIFLPAIKNASFVGPTKQNATDSKQGVPTDLFTSPAKEDN